MTNINGTVDLVNLTGLCTRVYAAAKKKSISGFTHNLIKPPAAPICGATTNVDNMVITRRDTISTCEVAPQLVDFKGLTSHTAGNNGTHITTLAKKEHACVQMKEPVERKRQMMRENIPHSL